MSPMEMITDEGLATRGIDGALSGIRKKMVEIPLSTLHSAAQRLRFIYKLSNSASGTKGRVIGA